MAICNNLTEIILDHASADHDVAESNVDFSRNSTTNADHQEYTDGRKAPAHMARHTRGIVCAISICWKACNDNAVPTDAT
jgi:hypothetical protein